MTNMNKLRALFAVKSKKIRRNIIANPLIEHNFNKLALDTKELNEFKIV
jgi:hypothetical protein